MAVPKLSIDEMVEVFELRVKGVCWENLSIIFNVSETTLKSIFGQHSVRDILCGITAIR